MNHEKVGGIDLRLNPWPDSPEVVAAASFVWDEALKVRGLRIVRDGARHIVSFPDRPYLVECAGCGHGIGITYKFCSYCGQAQPFRVAPTGRNGRPRLYDNTTYPVSGATRSAIERALLNAYLKASRPSLAESA